MKLATRILVAFALLMSGALTALAAAPPSPPPFSVLSGAPVVLSASNVSSRGQLPSTAVSSTALTFVNTGTKDAWCATGTVSVVATTASKFKVLANTAYTAYSSDAYVACITGGSDTTTITVYQGTGPIQFVLLTGSGGGSSGVTSWNSRTGAVVPVSGDYTMSQITQVAGSLGTAAFGFGTTNTGFYSTAAATEWDFQIGGVQTEAHTAALAKYTAANVSSQLTLFRNDASPAAHAITQINLDSTNASNAEVTFGFIRETSAAVTAGAELGSTSFSVMGGAGVAGTSGNMLVLTGNAAVGAATVNVPSGISVTIGSGLTAEGTKTLNVGGGLWINNLAALDASDNATFALLSNSGSQTNSANGANSTAALLMNGTILTGGNATTSFPALFIQPNGTAAVTSWSTAGTGLGMNLASGFTGNFLDFYIAGGSSLFSVNSAGGVNAGNVNVTGNAIPAVGMFNNSASLAFSDGSATQFLLSSSFRANNANGPLLQNAAGTCTAPSVVPNRSAATTGFSGDGTKLCGVIAGVDTFDVAAGKATINGVANTSILTSTGYSETGSDNTPMVSLAGTLNTTGASYDVFRMAVTNTATGANTNLMNLLAGAGGVTSEFSVTSNGSINAAGNISTAAAVSIGSAKGKLSSAIDGIITISNNAVTNSFILSAPCVTATPCTQFGSIDVDTSPVAQTLRSQGALAGGTSNVAGANWTFIASPGKGTGAGGSFIFQTTPAGSTGTVVGTPTTGLSLNSAGALANPTITTGTNADFVCTTAGFVFVIQSSACTISSERFKSDIHNFAGDLLDDVSRLRVATFLYKGKNRDPNGNVHQLGLIAEDVAKTMPLCAEYEKDMKTPKSYKQECMIAALVGSVQQLKTANDDLARRFAKLEAANDNHVKKALGR